jgi:hypothetical protein
LLIAFYNFDATGEGTGVIALVRAGAELVVMAGAGVEAEAGPGAEVGAGAGPGAGVGAGAPVMISHVGLGSLDLT